MRKLRIVALAAVILLPLAYFLGPRVEIVGTTSLPTLPADLETYVADVEARYGNVVPDTERKIVWAFEDRRQTDVSVIYLHGFSATRKETEPFADDVAKALGANLYYARLRGHGQPAEFLGSSRADEWIEDTAEALAIGARLGKKIVVMGCSTGATLGLHLSMEIPKAPVGALVFISPNFGSVQAGASLAAGPWGKQLVRLLVGKTYSWEIDNPDHVAYWSNHFPSGVLAEVTTLVTLVKGKDLSRVTAPIVFFYSENDTVIDPAEVKRAFSELGSKQKQLVRIDTSENPSQHVLAGHLVSSKSHDHVVQTTVAFLNKVL